MSIVLLDASHLLPWKGILCYYEHSTLTFLLTKSKRVAKLDTSKYFQSIHRELVFSTVQYLTLPATLSYAKQAQLE